MSCRSPKSGPDRGGGAFLTGDSSEAEPAGKGVPPERIKAWLRTVGYPLECATARTLRAAGFDARQGRSYMDVTASGGRVREIDVLAPLREVDQDVSVALV